MLVKATPELPQGQAQNAVARSQSHEPASSAAAAARKPSAATAQRQQEVEYFIPCMLPVRQVASITQPPPFAETLRGIIRFARAILAGHVKTIKTLDGLREEACTAGASRRCATSLSSAALLDERITGDFAVVGRKAARSIHWHGSPWVNEFIQPPVHRTQPARSFSAFFFALPSALRRTPFHVC